MNDGGSQTLDKVKKDTQGEEGMQTDIQQGGSPQVLFGCVHEHIMKATVDHLAALQSFVGKP